MTADRRGYTLEAQPLGQHGRPVGGASRPPRSAGCIRTSGGTNAVSAGAAVFDLDGVIVKTNLVKHAAMLSLFADHPEQQAAISARTVALLVRKTRPSTSTQPSYRTNGGAAV